MGGRGGKKRAEQRKVCIPVPPVAMLLRIMKVKQKLLTRLKLQHITGNLGVGGGVQSLYCVVWAS
jgi:hypothetical protein